MPVLAREQRRAANITVLEDRLKRLIIGDKAPDFSLPDHTGQLHRLSDLYRTRNVLLTFNIGFA
jgi:hypothetical protein